MKNKTEYRDMWVFIQHDGHMEFRFRNGMKCEYPQ